MSDKDYTKHAFPSHDIHPKKKDKEWTIKAAEAIYSRYKAGKCGINQSDVNSFRTLRKYAQGRQDTKQYKDRWLGKTTTSQSQTMNYIPSESTRKGFMNVNFDDILSIAPKFRAVTIGMFENENFKINADAIDEMSGAEKENKKWGLWFESYYQDFIKKYKVMVGLPQNKQDKFLPESLEELEMFEELGGFKLEAEIGMEKALAYTEYISNDKQLQRLLIGDLFDINTAWVKDYVNSETMKVEYRYVDPESLIVQSSKHYDYKDKTWVGELIPYTINSLRSSGLKISEEEFLTLANESSGIYGNSVRTYNEEPNLDGTFAYDETKVMVLDFEILTCDTYYKEKRKYKSGAVEFYERDNYEATSPPKEKSTEKKTTKKESVQVWRRGKWVVGTKHCWDYGLQYDIPRPTPSKARSSYHGIQLPGKSKVELMKPNLDSMQMLWLDLQNAKVQAPAAGLALEYQSLSNMTLKGKQMKPLDIIKIGVQTNKWIYKASTIRGQINTQGKPIQELEGGIGRKLQEIIQQFEFDLNFIRELTGITYGSDASNPKADIGLGVTEQLVVATNNALKEIYMGVIQLKESISLNICLRIKSLLREKKYYDGYYYVLGSKSAESFRLSSDKVAAQYGIKLQALPNDVDMIEIQKQLQSMSMSGKNGTPLITAGEYFAVLRMLKSGSSYKSIQQFLSNREIKAKRLEQQNQQQNQIMLAKTSQETEVNKQNQERETYAFKTQQDILKKQKEIEFELNKEVAVEQEKRKTQILIKEMEVQREKITA